MSDAQERSEGYVHPSGQQSWRHQNHEDDQEREHARHRRAQMVASAALCARTVGIAAYRGNIATTLPEGVTTLRPGARVEPQMVSMETGQPLSTRTAEAEPANGRTQP